MPEFYFITYEFKTANGFTVLKNIVADRHPFEWLKFMREQFPDAGTGALVFYKSINKAEFEMWLANF